MTLLSIISLFFIILIIKEIKSSTFQATKFSLIYLGVLIAFAIFSAWLPIKYWHLESFLENKSARLTEGRPVIFHCNSIVDSIFDNSLHVVGHANPRTGEIVFQYEWCKNIIGYLDHPNKLTKKELMSLNVFTHESMHIRGELDEKKTECQSVQRNYRAAKLLGIPDKIALQNAKAYYHDIYLTHPYFSPKCVKGGEYDEDLYDSLWNL